MRKAQKDRILSLASEYYEALNQIEEYYKQQNFEMCEELLAVCQEGAIAIGKQLEKEQEKEEERGVSRIVPLLEDFCEALFCFSNLLESANAAEVDQKLQRLRTRWQEVQRWIEEDIKVVLEIVFLPYKATMWDSLESIYLAASEDPDCHAVVIPIPYYNRKSDSSLGDKHYEIAEFPPEIPCISYENYDFVQEFPDVIYIHNPYDGGNLVSSVDPYFYSKNLKQLCRRLVYVPYFSSSGGPNSFDYLLSAYFHVDHIVVQSSCFLPFFTAVDGEKKCLVTGSPKFDKIAQLKKSQVPVPSDWIEKISFKKSVILNTSVDDVLQGAVNFLHKLDYIFATFRDRADFCLIWRPHPLLGQTFQSMRTDFYLEFEKRKEQYRKEGWGIYDETPIPEYTLAIADRYIGGGVSSLSTMFGAQGKPVFILNFQIDSLPNQADYLGSLLSGRYDELEEKYIVTEGNQLFEKRGDDTYHFICRLSEESMKGYGRAVECGKKIYVIPLHNLEIAVIEENHEMRKIPLRPHHVIYRFFLDSIRIGEYIFLIPIEYPYLVRFDLRNEEIRYLEMERGFFGDYTVHDNIKNVAHCIYENYLIVASPVKSYFMAIDYETMEVESVLPGGVEHGGFSCIATDFDQARIWFLPSSGHFFGCWDPMRGDVKTFDYCVKEESVHSEKENFKVEDLSFFSLVVSPKGVLLASKDGQHFLLFDCETKKFHRWNPPFSLPSHPQSCYYSCPITGVLFRHISDEAGSRQLPGTIRYFSMPDRKLYALSEDLEGYKEIPIQFLSKELKEHCYGFARHAPWRRYGCYEDAFHTLPAFLDGTLPGSPFDSVKAIQDYQEIIENADGTCGQKTHEAVKNILMNQSKGGR